MSKMLKFVLVCVIGILPLAANALGLGEIKLNSTLNQPLDASIPIVGASADELGSLHIKIASADQFKQAGIPMAAVLSELQFQIVPGANGAASVHITTTKPLREPFVDFLADATWDNGELIREYTVFINPPNFETTTQAAPVASAAQPVATPPVGAVASAPATASSTPVPTPAVTPVPATPQSAPQSAPLTAAVTPAISASNSPLGGNYGPIHRGETLSQIALNMRPQGVTLNQMMIAIYRANPEVFMRNINLMKAGYVLRVPTLADIQAVRVAEANAEVRTQIASWRASRGLTATNKPTGNTEQPSLQLVAPSSAAETAENQVPGVGKGKTGTAIETNTAGTGAGTGAGAASTTSNAPIAIASNNMAAVQTEASTQNKQAAETKVTPLNREKPAVVQPLPKHEITPTKSPSASGGLLDSLSSPYVIGIIVIILLALGIGIVMKKRRASAIFSAGKPVKIRKVPTANADWEKEEKAGLKDVTKLGSDQISDTAGSGSARGADLGATVSHITTTNLKLDESDPMAEADFHMAYGLYDQAADVLNKVLRQDPTRRDLRMKLLDVYFTAGDRSNFVETARNLRQEMGALPDKDWENISIMGRQVAPEDALFTGNGAATRSADAGVDIPLDSGGTGTNVHANSDPLAGAFEGMRPVTMPATADKPAASEEHVVDFSLPDIEPLPKSKKAMPAGAVTAVAATGPVTKPASEKKPGKSGESTVTADFGTDSQVEFDKALKELSDFVNTNVPPQEEGARSGTGQSMSLAADVAVPAAQTGTTTGSGEETTGLNEIGTKLDLARAYIDMGDAEGAKNILQEVIEEGDSQQQREAKKLIQQLT